MTKVGLLHTTIRGDEKLLIKAAKDRGLDLELIDMRKEILAPQDYQRKHDVVLERCISTTLGMHAITFFESLEIPIINNSEVANICVDKFATSLRLREKDVSTVPFVMVFSEDQAVQAIERLGGYPVVVKPPTGSWGRLIAKINDRDALEAVLEQKKILGSPPHKAFYIQKFIKKPDRDIRVTMVGGEVVCAIYRETDHWISNTARGAKAKKCEVDNELEKISKAASDAVGGGILGVDVFETSDGYLINEINHTTEFKNVQRVTGVDIAEAMLDYCLEVAGS